MGSELCASVAIFTTDPRSRFVGGVLPFVDGREQMGVLSSEVQKR